MKRNLIWALILVLAGFGVANAQETTSGSLGGTVTDTQGSPIPGATVTVTSSGVSKNFTTDANGRFFAPFLAPGMYTVRVELTGFSPIEQKDIQVRLGQRLELKELTLKVGEITETIEVVGAAPVVDTSTTTIGGILDADTISKLPVGRAFTDTLYMLPGVSDSSYAGKANPSIGGASGLENNFIIDGVNASNTGFGAIGSFSRQFGSLGTGVTQDFVKETQVKTGGFEAEYGQASGGVVNVVTRSGGNEFHGAIFGYIQPPALEASWKQLDSEQGTVNTVGTNNYDVGASLGGPIVKDKLFFFATFNPSWNTLTRTAPTGFPLESLGEVDRVRKTYSYAGKLSWQAGSNHRFDATFFGDPSDAENGPQLVTALVAEDATKMSSIDYGGHSQSLRYDGIITPNWLIEASAGRITNKFHVQPEIDTWSVTDRRVVPNVLTGGVGFYETDEGHNNQFSIKSTNLFNAAGSHQLRYGFSYEDIYYLQGLGRTGPTFTLSDGTQTTTGGSVQIRTDPTYGSIWRVIRAQIGPGRETSQKYWSMFLQDTWQIGRLTLRPGVRVENQKLKGSEEFPVCLSNQEFVGDVSGGGTPIACEYEFGPLWSPRIGATYDLFGNGKAKLFGSWGRFFVKVPNDLAARALSADAGVTVADYFDGGLTRPVPNGTLALGTTTHLTYAGLHPATIAPDVNSTYSDEFVGGFEWEAAPRLNVGVRYINRSIPVVMEDFAPAQVILYTYGIPPSIEYIIDNIDTQTPTTNPADFGLPFQQARFEDPTHKYQAIEVTFNKSFSDNWSLIGSYRWSDLTGNFEGFFRSDNGQADPGITSLFDFPTNDPSFTADGTRLFGWRGDIRYQGTTLGEGVLPNNRPHQFKLYANRTFGSLNAGLAVNVGSGRHLTALASNPGYQNSGEIPETLRGEGFETVDGFKESTDTETYLDAHLDYTIKMGNQRIILIADAFNLFNTQDPLDYDNYTESVTGVLNPNFGTPHQGGVARTPSYHAPFQLRLGARFEF